MFEQGRTIGPFRIEELLDRGFLLDVYKAFDTNRGQRVAIEVPTMKVDDPTRLVREVGRVAALSHPNVADVLEVRVVDGVPLIVAELLNGTTLREYLIRNRSSTRDRIDLLTQVADGLRVAHEGGVVHRDLRPANIMVTDERQVKILDFGIADLAKSDDHLLVGAPSYMAPELFRGEPVAAAADIFSLGVVAYEVLTGTNPFTRPTVAAQLQAVLEESPAPPAGVPPETRRIVARMLEKEPALRPTAADVVRELRSDRSAVIAVESSAREAFQVQFPDEETYYAALAAETRTLKPTVASDRRRFISIDVTTTEGQRQLRDLERRYGATIVEDYQYDMDYRVFEQDAVMPEVGSPATLDHVLQRIHATDAWAHSRGNGIAIAIVDTGVEGTRSEFPEAKRAGSWQAIGEDAWCDSDGHGTMCAAIAVASGGDFTGVAPDARLISCKVNFRDSQLALAYDYLTDLATNGLTIVASNSWGIYTGVPPAEKSGAQFPSALQSAIDAGVIVVCSAGNYHDLTTGKDLECGPTSIWLHKSRADLLTVATCKFDGEMWFYSSRGPGQHFGQENTNCKPDVTAPTPSNGLILYGTGTRILADGWGTSGAAPQVAGLAALLLSRAPGITRAELFAVIRDTAESLASLQTCCGMGMINCQRALTALIERIK